MMASIVLELQEQDVPTQHFPAVVNIINNHGTMSGNQFQQGATGSSQAMTIHSVESRKDELRAFTVEIRELLTKLNLNEGQKSEIDADIGTIEAQVKSSAPKTLILKESMASIRRVLEGTSSKLAADALIKFGPLLLTMAVW